ncbi:MAG TPA: hypothetical protein VJ549_04335 [Geothrix sp.]|nr:hypothetical protein [Geothrix sp.]
MMTLRSLALAALLIPALSAQTPPATPAPQAKETEPDPATLRAMKSKVFEIKHRSPLWLSNSLRALTSGVKGSLINCTDRDGLNTISVRDFPENIATIEEAIKRLDVQPAVSKDPNVELHVQVLFASKQPAPVGSVPEELQPVIQSLKGALAYRGYTLAASFVQRWDTSSRRAVQGKGEIEGASLGLGTAKEPSALRLEWEATPSSLGDLQPSDASTLQIPKFQLQVGEQRGSGGRFDLAKIETSVNLKDGEHVVVGTSMIKDHGLIVVLSAKRVN